MIDAVGRTCTKCRRYKTFDQFEKSQKGAQGYCEQCKKCRAVYYKMRFIRLSAKQRFLHRERSKEAMRRFREKRSP